MKRREKINIDAVAMVRKIRDENYKRCREMSPEERIADIRTRAERVNKRLRIAPKKTKTDREPVHA